MRLEEWQKWLDSQFLDSDQGGSVAVATEPPPGPAESSVETVRAYVEPPSVAAERSEASAIRGDWRPVTETLPSQVTVRTPEPVSAAPQAVPITPADSFDNETPVPSIENYLPYLRSRPEAPAVPPAAKVEDRADPIAEVAIEAEPAGVAVQQEVSPPVIEAAAPIQEKTVEAVEPPAPARRFGPTNRRSKHGRRTHAEQAASPIAAEELWSLVPRHLRTLVAMGGEEVAQNSYKRSFKETRIDLIQRLLDPTLSLEDTARLLNVCPTTVRRYTNRGMLRHQRTVGDQRRFKLSDVLSFLETQSKISPHQER